MSISTLGSAEPIERIASTLQSAKPRVSRRVAMDIVGALDVAAVVAGAILPASIYAIAGGLDIRWTVVCQSALITALLLLACMQAWNMYDTSKMHDLPLSPTRMFAALVMASFAALGLGLPFNTADVHLWIWYAAWISASFTFILGVRILCRSVLSAMTAAGRFDTRVAVFGAGEIARRVQDHLKSQKSGIHFVGVYDDRPFDRLDADGLDIKGRLEDLVEAGRHGAIDQIVIALPQAADRRTAMIAARLEQLPVSLHLVTHISSDLIESGPAHKVSSIGGVGLLDVKNKPLNDWAPFVKRTEDIVVGSLLLVLALPLMVLIAIAIKLESPGPVVFKQRRRGHNMMDIDVYKLRTMRVMENGENLEQAQENDPRITRVGAILRRTSLDELPQLLNVLRGEMSLVGPRPHAIAHDTKWSEMITAYGIRHQVKPGITGLAQVRGCRGRIDGTEDLAARVDQDVAYIRNWSLGLDLKILARTIGAALSGRNAY